MQTKVQLPITHLYFSLFLLLIENSAAVDEVFSIKA